MRWSVFHPDGFYMCDIEIAETGDANTAMINDVDSATFKPTAARFVKNPDNTNRDIILADLVRRGLVRDRSAK